MPFHLTVEGFPDGGTIPPRFTCEGEDVSPPLSWSGEPDDTKSFALIVDDPDAPSGTWNHWLLWDIPAFTHTLPEDDGKQNGVAGTNDFGRRGYGGPCPPRHRGAHRYFFRLFAVDAPSLKVPPGARRSALEKALRGHVLAGAEYRGHFSRD